MNAQRNRSEIEQEIKETIGVVPSFFDQVPDRVLDQEWGLFKHWELEKTVIPNKYKELLMLAVHAGTKCRYCILFHTEAAKLWGATDEEIEEAVELAKHSMGWSTYLNGMRVDFDQFTKDVHRMGEFLSEQVPA